MNLRISLLFNFVMVYLIYKILLLIKNNMNYLKDNLFEFFLRNVIKYLFFRKIFVIIYNDGKSKV